MYHATAIAVTANEMGTTEMYNGHVQSPISKALLMSHQPKLRPSMSPNTRLPLARTLRTAPPQSMLRARSLSLDSVTKRKTPMVMRTPRGMLIPKAQFHENSVVSQPPSSGPTATIPPIVEPHTANAMPRSLPWKVALTIERVVGRTMAPPIP